MMLEWKFDSPRKNEKEYSYHETCENFTCPKLRLYGVRMRNFCGTDGYIDKESLKKYGLNLFFLTGGSYCNDHFFYGLNCDEKNFNKEIVERNIRRLKRELQKRKMYMWDGFLESVQMSRPTFIYCFCQCEYRWERMEAFQKIHLL